MIIKKIFLTSAGIGVTAAVLASQRDDRRGGTSPASAGGLSFEKSKEQETSLSNKVSELLLLWFGIFIDIKTLSLRFCESIECNIHSRVDSHASAAHLSMILFPFTGRHSKGSALSWQIIDR